MAVKIQKQMADSSRESGSEDSSCWEKTRGIRWRVAANGEENCKIMRLEGICEGAFWKRTVYKRRERSIWLGEGECWYEGWEVWDYDKWHSKKGNRAGWMDLTSEGVRQKSIMEKNESKGAYSLYGVVHDSQQIYWKGLYLDNITHKSNCSNDFALPPQKKNKSKNMGNVTTIDRMKNISDHYLNTWGTSNLKKGGKWNENMTWLFLKTKITLNRKCGKWP